MGAHGYGLASKIRLIENTPYGSPDRWHFGTIEGRSDCGPRSIRRGQRARIGVVPDLLTLSCMDLKVVRYLQTGRDRHTHLTHLTHRISITHRGGELLDERLSVKVPPCRARFVGETQHASPRSVHACMHITHMHTTRGMFARDGRGEKATCMATFMRRTRVGGVL